MKPSNCKITVADFQRYDPTLHSGPMLTSAPTSTSALKLEGGLNMNLLGYMNGGLNLHGTGNGGEQFENENLNEFRDENEQEGEGDHERSVSESSSETGFGKSKTKVSAKNSNSSSKRRKRNYNYKCREVSSFKVFMNFVQHFKDGECDAKDILSEECYDIWLSTRRKPPKVPQEAFRRALTAHCRGVDGRRPFPANVERSLLMELRRKKPWRCFMNMKECGAIGIQGFPSLGYHESREQEAKIDTSAPHPVFQDELFLDAFNQNQFQIQNQPQNTGFYNDLSVSNKKPRFENPSIFSQYLNQKIIFEQSTNPAYNFQPMSLMKHQNFNYASMDDQNVKDFQKERRLSAVLATSVIDNLNPMPVPFPRTGMRENFTY